MSTTTYSIEPIGFIRSELTRLEAAPLQGDEGAPEAWLELTPPAARGLAGITTGDELIVLTWLHLARRDVLSVHPRDSPDNPLTGVFATRSQDRPNPVGLHRVSVLEVAEQKLRVAPLEAVNGTPIVDIKPVLKINEQHPPPHPTLSRFISTCQSDPHILAAILYGSHATGAADAWSDLDIGMVIVDNAYDDFTAGREDFIRQLGEPLFIEDFDNEGILFFILADGTEGELSFDRASDFIQPYGPWRALVDKDDVLSKAKPRPQPNPADQVEALRRQITWFWHDLSHFITAMGRGQLWWAAGQLEVLRRICVNLARLRHEFADGEVGDDPWFKLDKSLPDEALALLRETFVPLDYAAMLAAARVILSFYRELATPLAEAHGIRYPVELERLMRGRLAMIDK